MLIPLWGGFRHHDGESSVMAGSRRHSTCPGFGNGVTRWESNDGRNVHTCVLMGLWRYLIFDEMYYYCFLYKLDMRHGLGLQLV